MSRQVKFGTLVTDKAATGIEQYVNVRDFKHLVLSLDFSDTSTMTAKIQGSVQETAPNFAAAASKSNSWDYIEAIDLEDGAAIDGDTGIAVTANDHRLVEVNVNGLEWVCVELQAYTAGKLNVSYEAFSNN
jgi:hypothetical protein